jgi:hypothetical protein
MGVKTSHSIEIPCHGSIIKSIFRNNRLFRIWFKDDHVVENKSLEWKEWFEFESRSVDSMYFEKIDSTQSGIYKCVIFDASKNRMWTLNRLELIVGDVKMMNAWIFSPKFKIYFKSFSAIFATIIGLNFLANIFMYFRK